VPERARIAIIGAGWWASAVYIPALLDHPEAEIVGICRPDREGLDRLEARFGLRGYEDAEAMLRAERPDGAIVASPHWLHAAHGLMALRAGAHLMVEKPMATSAAEARALVAEAAARGRHVILPYGWNFKDFARRAADLVAAGRVGEPRHVALQMASATRDLFAGEGLAETAGALFRPQASTWADPARAGGYGWGQLTHALGLMFEVVRLAPAEVFAWGGLGPSGVDYYDAMALRFANGATGTVSGAATMPKGAAYQLDLRVFGTEGMLLLDMERARMELRRDDGEDEVAALDPEAGAYAAVAPVHRLIDACLGRMARNEAGPTVGLRAVEALDAMYRSMASGRPERV
jgi:predicted dehydrogenase